MLRNLGLNAIPLHGKMSQVLVYIWCASGVHTHIITLSTSYLYLSITSHLITSQPKRLGSLNKFKSKTRSILIATDVASRGLDIPHVDVVINNDIPTHSKVYTCIYHYSVIIINMISTGLYS